MYRLLLVICIVVLAVIAGNVSSVQESTAKIGVQQGHIYTDTQTTSSFFPQATTTALSQQSTSTLSLLFTGDVMLARDIQTRLQEASSSSMYPFQNMPSFAMEYPYIIGNFESSIPTVPVHTPNFTFQFSVDASFLPVLHQFGFTHLNLANNHSYDFGQQNYFHTREVLTQYGFVPFGNQKIQASTSVAFLEHGSTTIALIGIEAITHVPKQQALEKLFGYVRRHSDFQIVYIHWGTEYRDIHTQAQEVLARRLVEQGADLIVGHHPHVIEDIGSVAGVPVFYSLGNFVFDQYFNAQVQTGLLLGVHIMSNKLKINLIPVSSLGMHGAPQVLQKDAKTVMLRDLAQKSNPSFTSSILQGTIIIPY